MFIQYYDKAISIDRRYVPSLGNKENVLSDLGQYEEAISYYKVLEIFPHNLFIIYNKGLTLIDKGDYSQAIDLA